MSHFVLHFFCSLVATKCYLFGEMSKFLWTPLFNLNFFFVNPQAVLFILICTLDEANGCLKCLLKSLISANDLRITLGSFLHDFQEL